MTDIVERLRFDAATFSKGVASNIEEAVDEIERLRAELLTVACPAGGWTGMPERLEGICTVADCLKDGSCGCSHGAAIGPAERASTSELSPPDHQAIEK